MEIINIKIVLDALKTGLNVKYSIYSPPSRNFLGLCDKNYCLLAWVVYVF